MNLIFLILAIAAAVGVVYAVQEILTKRREDRELRERLGSEYEEFIRRRLKK